MIYRSNKVEADYKNNLLHPSLRNVILSLEILAVEYHGQMPDGIEIELVDAPDGISVSTEGWSSKFKQRVTTVLVIFRQLSKQKIRHEFIDEFLHIELTEVA